MYSRSASVTIAGRPAQVSRGRRVAWAMRPACPPAGNSQLAGRLQSSKLSPLPPVEPSRAEPSRAESSPVQSSLVRLGGQMGHDARPAANWSQFLDLGGRRRSASLPPAGVRALGTRAASGRAGRAAATQARSAYLTLAATRGGRPNRCEPAARLDFARSLCLLARARAKTNELAGYMD